ncbi:MAG: hypothetical protein ACYS18_02100 [Planctomycetota bacterium]|jgi:hypothetical protein
MVRLLIKLFSIALGITVGMILMGVCIGLFPSHKQLIAGCFIICFLAICCVGFRGSVSEHEVRIRKWAEVNGYEIVRVIVLPSTAGLWAMFFIHVKDSEGRKKKGIGWCGGISSSNKVKINWWDWDKIFRGKSGNPSKKNK